MINEYHDLDSHPTALQRLLNEYAAIFEVSQGLPLLRSSDHQIPLIDPMVTVSARSTLSLPISLEK